MKERGCKVLVIDDVPEMEEMIKLLLTYERNDQVRFATNGDVGLAIAKQDPPDLIILDVMMPQINGYEVCRQIKATPALRDIPILFVTVVPPRMGYPETQRLGGAGYLCKPYKINEILEARDAVLRGETYYPDSLRTGSRF
jgi:DNA-binding response OmpR family regulator